MREEEKKMGGITRAAATTTAALIGKEEGRNSLDAKGASIYDVRTEGGRGVRPKEDVVREVA